MKNSHSSVIYVEPNISSANLYKNAENKIESWKVDDDYDRTPRLEDYSIYFNLEVEICSRENISANETITSDVLILSYHTKPNETASTVNFMGGTKIKCSDKNNSSIPFLTTNYADMYVGDLIDYGTTEMIGIKSIDIDYQSSCVPIVTVKFTDVRGLSLFQPTELSRTNSYQGIKGINIDNVAQSFFQCFFRVPMPRFTMTLKGFYGNPVTYECLCDKFDTNFNSQTGDFDVTTRFIGYSYSFLTDVSIDALLAAPYSDYGGRDSTDTFNAYWNQQVEVGRFFVYDKQRNHEKMPTLFEVWQNIKTITQLQDKETAITEEDKTHAEELEELVKFKGTYQKWYDVLFGECVRTFGKDYCYIFNYPNEEKDYYRILILTRESNEKSLENFFTNTSDEFKTINNELYALIEEYNKKDYHSIKLKNVSKTFSEYSSKRLFNKAYLGAQNQVVFGGFHKYNTLPETEIIQNIFNNVSYSESKLTKEEISEKEKQHKKHVLDIIYGDDGHDQYIRCYSINIDYSSLLNRIKSLQTDANRNQEEKDKEEKIKEINRKMFSRMNWYPTVENFTRIMMAHMETLMALMYGVASKCEGRTAKELGISVGSDGDAIDVNSSKDTIPPFPRVTRRVLGDDNITKVEDTWVGEFKGGVKPFEEVDFIEGFFNAIEKLRTLVKDTETTIEENQKETTDESDSFGGVVKNPLSAFDFYINKSPYGDTSNMFDTNLYEFAGKVGIRMFTILSLSHFREEFGNGLINEVENIAKVEAENFNNQVKITNSDFIGVLRGDKDGLVNEIIKILTTKDSSHPWGNIQLFHNGADNMWLNGYATNATNQSRNFIYPIQNVSFDQLKSVVNSFNQNNIQSSDGDISIYTIPDKPNSIGTTNNGFGTVLITEDTTHAKKILEGSDNIDEYNGIKNKLSEACIFTGDYNDWGLSIGGDAGLDEGSTAGLDFNLSLYNEQRFNEIYQKLNTKSPKYFNLSLNKDERKLAALIISLVPGEGGIKKAVKEFGKGAKKSFIYAPKLTVLQIGFLSLLCLGDMKNTIPDKFSVITQTVNNFSKQTKYQYASFFCECVKNQELIKLFKSFRQGKTDEIAKKGEELKNEFLKPYLIINLSVNNFSGKKMRDYPLKQDIAKKYLNAFIERLTANIGINTEEDSSGNLIKTVDEPKQTTSDMKMELYRYMKQLYDKWIPMSPLEDWKIERYFINEDGEHNENVGHKFYFIDSFYNNIGDKLLINPQNLMERIEGLLNYGDVNAMMLGFMADIYAYNRCMMKCIQNFFDLSNEENMKEMFSPKPYNSIEWSTLNKYSSFVIVYPYEPSKNLNIPNNEYNDDGFMLNDEYETPQAIRTKSDKKGHYKIPAFGVAYGKQYQSYFKSVNVNMQSPIATEQSIKAKHYILQKSAEVKTAGITAQDLYDIYSTQSYTCDVEMMGCAWIQPMMYFVLLNVPMFRGSYLIMKVRHSIKPGNMTTTFTGCRMAKTSNKLIENIFTDDGYSENGTSASDIANAKALKANIDNDCPYKIYSLWGDDEEGIAFNLDKKGLAEGVKIMKTLMDSGLNVYAAAGTVGNMFCESRFNEKAIAADTNNEYAGGLCQWNGGNLKALCEDNCNKYGLTPSDTSTSSKSGKIEYWRSKLPTKEQQIKFFICTLQSKDAWHASMKRYGKIEFNFKTFNQYSTSPEDAAELWRAYYGIGGNNDNSKKQRQSAARTFFNAYQNGGTLKGEVKSEKKDKKSVEDALFEAINKSAIFTPSIGIELKSGKTGGYVTITQQNGNGDKLGIIFDMILNSEYLSYVQELYWVYGRNGISSDPLHIDYKASENVSKRVVRVAESGKIKDTQDNAITSGHSETLLRALAKYANKVGNENNFKRDVPQMSKSNIKILDKYKPTDCDSLFSTNDSTGSYSNNSGGVGAEYRDNFKIGDWNVSDSVRYLLGRTTPCGPGISKCAQYVQLAIGAGGIAYRNGHGYRTVKNMLEAKIGWKLVASGKTDSSEFATFTPSLGDVLGMTKGGDFDAYGHVCMYCGDKYGWISDFRQTCYIRKKWDSNRPLMYTGYVYNSKGPGTYWIMRYTGSGGKKR